MTNGRNDWGVPFSDIVWFDRLLKNHGNVASVERSLDILFLVDRRAQEDTLTVLCLREYTMGMTLVQRALNEFGYLDVIYIGGGWNGYTPEAKQYCLESNIGLYVTDEMSGALWIDEYWNYHKNDEEGNPKYFIRAS
jgi:hypothetical protein